MATGRRQLCVSGNGVQMQLLCCAECGRAVSRHAASCPRCGAGLEPMSDAAYVRARAAADAARAKDRRFTLFAACGVGVLLLLAVAFGLPPEERRVADERELRDHVETLPERQRERESDRFWRSAGMEKGEGRR